VGFLLSNASSLLMS